MHDCCLCSQIEGRPENDLIARLLPDAPYSRRVPLETASFAVVPSLGPLTPGHMLLCPKRHVKSFAALEGELDREYASMAERLEARLCASYARTVVVFEHGMAAEGGRVPCSVEHAHRHFVPLPPHADASLDARLPWQEYDGTLASLRALSAGREYIAVRAPDGIHRLVLTEDSAFESQYMRRVLASCIGGVHWNWREQPDARAADEAWRRLASPSAEAHG